MPLNRPLCLFCIVLIINYKFDGDDNFQYISFKTYCASYRASLYELNNLIIQPQCAQ